MSNVPKKGQRAKKNEQRAQKRLNVPKKGQRAQEVSMCPKRLNVAKKAQRVQKVTTCLLGLF
jgi:hypothetical protein